MKSEQRTARFTVLIDPGKKAVFERLCALDDLTPSQVIRRLIRDYIETRAGRPWQPGDRPEQFPTAPVAASEAAQRKRPRRAEGP